MQGFKVPRHQEKLQKSTEIEEKPYQKDNRIYDKLWTYIFIECYRFWTPSWAPFFLQNRSKRSGEVRGTSLFFNFCFYRLSGVPQAPDLGDFGPQLGATIAPKSDLKLIFSTSEVTSDDFQDFEGRLTRNARF